MRYLKLESAENPITDYIELNDFNGFLCTSFQSIGISRKLEFLSIQNRQFVVDNKPEFKKYSLTVEILSKYSEYEAKHRELITFLDRNKKSGLRLCYSPYSGMKTRYCLCSIESSVKTEKRQPVVITLTQCSLWLGEEKIGKTAQNEDETSNIFGFFDDGNGYYCASFLEDENIANYYCVSFFSNVVAEAIITNISYNEILLNIRIRGKCVNPEVSLFRKGENEPIRRLEIMATIDNGYYVEINSHIGENGVWRVNTITGEKIPFNEFVNNEHGSPYLYIGYGEYIIKVTDDGNNVCETEILYQEEFSE